MLRLFQTNSIRKVIELEGDWDFQPVGEKEGIPTQFHYRLPVPGCWEMHPDFLTYRGRAAYRKKLHVEKKTLLRLCFKGVSHTAVVYFDGEKIADHYNAYTAFTAYASAEPGEHEMIVLVDNAFHEDSKLHFANDYYTYGGMIRPVAVEYIDRALIERIQFTPKKDNGGWQADVEAVVTNVDEHALEIEVSGLLGDKRFSFGKRFIGGGETVVFHTTERFENVLTWSDKSPNLYLLEVQLKNPGEDRPFDDCIERVGFRTVTTKDGKIQVNGEDIVLKGFNRHEDHPLAGAAIPYQLMVHDVELITDMGANAVRTSHYPNDDRFLDLCDERGIYVWEENHARGFELEHMLDRKTQEQCLNCNREMVHNHYNHPSIIIWAVLNECASHTPEGRELYREQLEQIRQLDCSRPLTYATHHRGQDICFDLADIVSFNLYPLWYTDEDPGKLCDQARKWADEAGGLGKPMIMSEFGADGYYGLRDRTQVRGTEERQADILAKIIVAYSSRSYLAGMFIWQFADCRVVEDTGWLLSRAGTQNNKGIVDRYRRPKLAYEVVKKFFT
ncbi:beta-glucuronidase [Evansella caseinilytica]|uniref:Beta-glucuronidase n=1 Tax=Evansella caseinilytica TaxID=1503961 RepID=A0A1H3RZ48_9BACI|nr:glycoside hydrolase family 2 TIM barrel-domain containing protein [Evansella caseinilytica]SDZ31006.1 beta-glucuronidase [Evansella caseinilytica]